MSRPSLAGVLSGQGPNAGLEGIYGDVRQLINAHKQRVELSGAEGIIRSAVGGGDGPMDPVKSAAEMLRMGGELATDKETRQREAQAVEAQARVEEMKAKGDLELGTTDRILKVLEMSRSTDSHGGLTLEGMATLVAALRPADTQSNGGLTLEGIAALITALNSTQPKNDVAERMVDKLTDKLERLEQKISQGGGGSDIRGTLAVLKEFQGVLGSSPADRREDRRLDLEEHLSLRQAEKEEKGMQFEAEERGRFYDLVGDVFKEKPWQNRPANGQAPQGDTAAPAQSAVQHFKVRCGACNQTFPVTGEPRPSYECPNCGATIGVGE